MLRTASAQETLCAIPQGVSLRKYYCSVSAIIFNNKKKILLVSKDGISSWQVVTGWLENEDIQDGIKREISEELGKIRFKIYDILDVHSFHHKKKDLISVWYLLKYLDGQIQPSDDIEGYSFSWFDYSELKQLNISCPKQFELFEKAFYLIKQYEKNIGLSFLKFNK
jgi:8-oxo-dGTP pyrophosphatase MutT (NUDIX family)